MPCTDAATPAPAPPPAPPHVPPRVADAVPAPAADSALMALLRERAARAADDLGLTLAGVAFVPPRGCEVSVRGVDTSVSKSALHVALADDHYLRIAGVADDVRVVEEEEATPVAGGGGEWPRPGVRPPSPERVSHLLRRRGRTFPQHAARAWIDEVIPCMRGTVRTAMYAARTDEEYAALRAFAGEAHRLMVHACLTRVCESLPWRDVARMLSSVDHWTHLATGGVAGAAEWTALCNGHMDAVLPRVTADMLPQEDYWQAFRYVTQAAGKKPRDVLEFYERVHALRAAGDAPPAVERLFHVLFADPLRGDVDPRGARADAALYPTPAETSWASFNALDGAAARVVATRGKE